MNTGMSCATGGAVGGFVEKFVAHGATDFLGASRGATTIVGATYFGSFEEKSE